ncbi:MAG: DUF4249 family protein [Saprospiraceae bacterium]
MYHSEYGNTASLKGLFFLIVAFSYGCLTEIDLKVPDSNTPNLAIRGAVTLVDTPYVEVRITDVSNFNRDAIPQGVAGAQVKLFDDEGHQLDIPMQDEGFYRLNIPEGAYDLEVHSGKAYQLSVHSPDGKYYLSEMDTLYPVPTPSSLHKEQLRKKVLDAGSLVEKEFFKFSISTPILNPGARGRAHLLWDCKGTYKFTEPPKFVAFLVPDSKTCYYFQELENGRVLMFNGSESQKDELLEFKLFEEEIDYRFREGFYLTVVQQSISAGAFEYWNKVRELTSPTATVYDPPPGKVRGNIRNVTDDTEEVFGYFYAKEEKLIRMFISPSEVRVDVFCLPEINLDNWEMVDPYCFDCLLRPNSTVIRPDWWEE